MVLTHALDHPVGLQELAKLIARVLSAPIRMEDQAMPLWMQGPSVGKGFHHQVLGHPVGSAVAQHLSGLDADDHRQMQPALTGGDIGDVSDPRRRPGTRSEFSIQQIRGEGRTSAGSVAPPAPLGLTLDALLGHQPRHALMADVMIPVAQGPDQPMSSIAALAGRIDSPKLGTECCIGVGGCAGLSAQIVMESRDGYSENTAQHPSRVASPMAGDEGVPHLDSLAKNAAAFFRISRSILRLAFSARRRLISLSRSVASEVSDRPARTASTQLASVLTGISSCRAAAAGPSDSASATA